MCFFSIFNKQTIAGSSSKKLASLSSQRATSSQSVKVLTQVTIPKRIHLIGYDLHRAPVEMSVCEDVEMKIPNRLWHIAHPSLSFNQKGNSSPIC